MRHRFSNQWETEFISQIFPLILSLSNSNYSPLLLFDETQFFLKIKHDPIRPVLCYREVLRFFKMSQSFDQIPTLTYVLMDNFLSLFPIYFYSNFFLLDSRERSEISKTRKRANLLKKKVLSAGNLGPKQEKGNLNNLYFILGNV